MLGYFPLSPMNISWSTLVRYFRKHSAVRWLTWISTLLVTALVVSVLVPVFRQYPEGIHSFFTSSPVWMRYAFTFLISLLVVALHFRLLSPRLAHLATFRFSPPIWLAVAGAWLIACLLDVLLGLGSTTSRASIWEWLLFGGLPVACFAVARSLANEQPVGAAISQTESPTAQVGELLEDWPRLEQWLLSENPATEDLLGHREVARRLAQYLTRDGGTVGIVGPFGSGKTSLINWIDADLTNCRDISQPRLLLCVVSCWGFEDAAGAVHEILDRAVRRATECVDCFSVRHLPETYRQTFSAGGDWVRTLADLVIGKTDPLEQLRYLADTLEAAHARLVIAVEDLDRNTSSRFDPQEVQALLHRLKLDGRLSSISFILTGSQASRSAIDFARLCDRIEVLSAFDATRIAPVVDAARHHCLSAYPHFQLTPRESPWTSRSDYLLVRYDLESLSASLCRLLQTPRALKQALRTTHRVWASLVGEVDFDHLLAIQALRSGAPEALDFLLRNALRLRDDPRRWQGDRNQLPALRQRLQRDWRRSVRKVDWDRRAALELVRFALPATGQYFEMGPRHDENRHQGVAQERYWRRAINETLDPNQVPDQRVLRDIEAWLRNPSPDSRLVDGLMAGGDYVDVWENNAWLMEGVEDGRHLLALAEQVFARLRTPAGSRSSDMDSHPAFIALWRRANGRVPRTEESGNWLESQVRLAIVYSLPLVLDLCYYWGGTRLGIVRPEDRHRIRRTVHEVAQQRIRSGVELLHIVHPQISYDIYQLIVPPGDETDGPSELRGPEHWSWLGPILRQALQLDPELMAPKIANVLSDQLRDFGRGGYQESRVANGASVSALFGDDADSVFRLLSEAANRLNSPLRENVSDVVESARSQRLWKDGNTPQ